MPEHSRETDGYIPVHVKWVMKFINNIGFPIAVCVWMAYQQYTQGRETIRTLNEFREVVQSLKASIDQQTRYMRHRVRDD